MNNTLKKATKKPKQKIIGSIFETYDYEIFKTLEGNRDVNQVHIKNLMKSMQEKYLISPVIVNRDMSIIDGQHRYEAAKKLELPIRYIIDENADLRAVQLLNARSKDWSPQDYMESYIKLGYEEYIKYKNFKDLYKLPHQITQVLLQTLLYDGKKRSEIFNTGFFKINRLDIATKVAELANKCFIFYNGSKRRSFILALLSVCQKEDFNTNEFLRKLEMQRAKMYDCAKTSQYIILIEDIYNYKRRNKVNLRI